MKNINLFLLAASIVLFSCAEQPKEKKAAEDVLSVSIIEMLANPLEYEGEMVSFEGAIDHVCRHSGDKMRVSHMDDSDYSILVMLGDFMNKLDANFEGESIMCKGVLNIEMREIEEPTEPDHDHEPGDHSCETTEEAIKKMEELGIDPEIRAYIEMAGFEIKN